VPRFLADENFNNDIVRGLLRLIPTFDVVRAQDVGLMSATDPDLLEWAAQNGRIVLTHDLETVTYYAYERLRTGQRMPGVVEISPLIPVGAAIEGLHLLILGSFEEEWENQVRYPQIS
jgi:hypothetical protein